MEDMQPKKTSNMVVAVADFITIRDLLKDSNQYFKNRIELKSNTSTYEDYDHLEYLSERCTNVQRLINDFIENANDAKPQTDIGESEENTSYLDMSMRKYENFELTQQNECSNRNEYVDVTGKASKDCNDDDNIYDNYIVERNDKGTTVHAVQVLDIDDKQDCPFIGLPAAHLTIMHSPKVGWLTMHLRRKRFIHHFSINFKRKYYTGLVSKHNPDYDYYEWWILMYAGGTSDLKPTICLPLNQFEACADNAKITTTTTVKTNEKQPNENKRNPCKFELKEKSTKKDAKSYCFIAETPEHCEHWTNLLKQLSNGLPYIENSFTATAQIRRLPMPPLNAKNTDNDRLTADIDTVDTTMHRAQSNNRIEDKIDTCNYSEGVYEEPEEYYKNVPTSTCKIPMLPMKKVPIQSQTSLTQIQMDVISSIYDTPKKPVRITDDTKQHYDLIIVQNGSENESKSTTVDAMHECNRLKIDNEIRNKLSTQLKEQSQKYLSSSGRRTSDDDDMTRNSTTTDGTPNKYQLSTMRKWLFSNHLAKLRQSTNPTNFMRKSSGCTIDTAEKTQPKLNQRHKTSAVSTSTDTQKRAFSIQPKGKVHMIINQLEANGQLTLLTSSNKCSTPMSA
ncbi:uncharacterized protein LOC116339318 [Contarinia nasturtii]|uniref:uncharacterized protein LOC116339318 n=1 Tax=Contarinia nasturtii TaxID=265458 RepID=UPI0012D37EE9|nr:uncharacterized protein LOC116339318 [Contarinia nasturtii]